VNTIRLDTPEALHGKSGSPIPSAFLPVSLSLADLCGEEYIRAVCANHAFLTGESPGPVAEAAFKRVEFFPAAFERRLLQLLPKVGHKVGTRLAHTPAGATTRQFEAHSKLDLAPLGAWGYFRIGEDGHLYLITKSEHYHAPLGHAFPGFVLLDKARRLGIPNATHNNTRGFITRRLEVELVAAVNGLAASDAAGLKTVMASTEPDVLNRVLNLETGSLAVEAALKLMLARFYRPDETQPLPKYQGRIPVLLVLGDDDGALRANYHGTTILTQVMRGMWPELYGATKEHGFRVAAIRPDSIADLEAAFVTYQQGNLKIAGFFHEIVMMNYGGRLLSREFLARAYELCRQHDVPVVADEIQSCLWAPGLFLHREYGLRPSFLAIGKGFPGGEYAASRLLFSAAFDSLPQFGALVTNGQAELAALAYLVTMRWAVANAAITRQIGEKYASRLRELAAEFPKVISSVDGYGHLSCLRFQDTASAVAFAKLLVAQGLDVSAQTYKADCPPSVLTKLPLIAGYEVVDFVVGRIREALRHTATAATPYPS
jgi:acetylornithine/succinyldiaminopimelate/putrescine aminotransferase